ncbi:hypothetical protein EAF04_004630 [Stromatinia cepivora]|nr:hypothetical protein EAF04_004630 [Stromatinia cepivora]
MGIPGLWDLIADCKEIVSLAELATQHFEQHKRPLRIAVDEATWRHKLYISNKGKLCKKYSTIHLNERNLITFVLRLLKLNIQLIFVADGPHKPNEKYKGKGAGVWKFKNNVLQECLRLLGVKWHDAPGEAEAECAVLQRRGVVDCVWTEDGDALMFGCGVLVRFCYWDEEEEGENEKGKGKGKGKGGGAWTAKRSGMKDLDRVVLYRASAIQAKNPGFDREGLVLFVLLSGGDYGKGLQDCGVGKASKVVGMGFGRELFHAIEISGDLETWRNNLRKYFMGSKTGVSVPGSFPDRRIWGLYNSPSISSVERLEKLEENVWRGKINERELQAFLVEKFNWGIDKYIDYVVPILLTQYLASFDRNGKSNMDEYNLTYMEFGLKCNVWYSLFAITSLGKGWVDKCIEDVNKKRANNWKRYELPWGKEATVEGRDLLTCIVKHAMEPDTPMAFEPEYELEKTISKSRRRSLSPQRSVLEDRTRIKKSRISISPPPTPTPRDRFVATKEEISFDISMCEELDEDLLDEPMKVVPKPFRPSHSSSPSIILDEQETQQGHDASVEMALDSIESLGSPRNACCRIRPAAYTDPKFRSTQYTSANLLSDITANSVPKSPAPLPHSSQFATTNEEYINTYHIAMDEPLDSDSECEFLNTSFSKPRASNLPPTNHKSSHPNSHSHTTSTSTPHLNPTSNTTNSLPIHSLPPNKIPHEFKFEYEFENDFLIAMDEPLDFDLDLDLDSETEIESLDAKFSISSISKPTFEQRQLASNPHFITHSSFPSDLEMSSDGRIVSAACGYGQDGDVGMEEDMDIATDEELEQELNLDNEQQASPSSPFNNRNSTNSKILEDVSAHNTNTSSSTPGTTTHKSISTSSTAPLNPSPNQNQNAPAPAPANPNPNPNILLYPSHPTGPYQELDISQFFSDFPSLSQSQSQSQAQVLSQSQAQNISSSPAHPHPLHSNLQ